MFFGKIPKEKEEDDEELARNGEQTGGLKTSSGFDLDAILTSSSATSMGENSNNSNNNNNHGGSSLYRGTHRRRRGTTSFYPSSQQQQQQQHGNNNALFDDEEEEEALVDDRLLKRHSHRRRLHHYDSHYAQHAHTHNNESNGFASWLLRKFKYPFFFMVVLMFWGPMLLQSRHEPRLSKPKMFFTVFSNPLESPLSQEEDEEEALKPRKKTNTVGEGVMKALKAAQKDSSFGVPSSRKDKHLVTVDAPDTKLKDLTDREEEKDDEAWNRHAQAPFEKQEEKKYRQEEEAVHHPNNNNHGYGDHPQQLSPQQLFQQRSRELEQEQLRHYHEQQQHQQKQHHEEPPQQQQQQHNAVAQQKRPLVNYQRGHRPQLIPEHLRTTLADVWEPIKPTDTPLFWHIPKDAGTTLCEIMTHCLDLVMASNIGAADGGTTLQVHQHSDKGRYVNVDVASIEGIQRARKLGLARSGLAEAIVVHRFHEGSTLFDPEHRARVFCLFRHPVRRAVSLFYYLQRAKWEPTYDPTLGKMTLADYAVSRKAEENWITRFLTHEYTAKITDHHVSVAKEIMRNKMVIGLLEDFQESLKRFELYFDWWATRVRGPHAAHMIQCQQSQARSLQNRAPHPSPTESDEAYQRLLALNWADMELYDYARQLFQEQAELVKYKEPSLI